jgi:hypothetical protein
MTPPLAKQKLLATSVATTSNELLASEALCLAKRNVFVDAWFWWKTQHALTNNVALHFIAATSNAVTRRTQNVFVPGVGAPFAVVGY